MYSASAEPGSALISCIFLRPALVTNRRLALESWGRTLLNCPTTCLRMFGGASWRRGSRAGRWTHFCRMFFRAFLLYKIKNMEIYLAISLTQNFYNQTTKFFITDHHWFHTFKNSFLYQTDFWRKYLHLLLTLWLFTFYPWLTNLYMFCPWLSKPYLFWPWPSELYMFCLWL